MNPAVTTGLVLSGALNPLQGVANICAQVGDQAGMLGLPLRTPLSLLSLPAIAKLSCQAFCR
jgi:hypothetical protein